MTNFDNEHWQKVRDGTVNHEEIKIRNLNREWPKGIRPHKSGKLVVDICVNGVRRTAVFPTLQQAIIGRVMLKEYLEALARQRLDGNQQPESLNIINNNPTMENTAMTPATIMTMNRTNATPVTNPSVYNQKQPSAIIGEGARANKTPTSTSTFTFPVTGQTVRTVMMDGGKPWFVARDVAGVLGYSNLEQAIRINCKNVKVHKQLHGSGLTTSPRGINIIPESDVYQLIMSSKLPSAVAFKDWVCEEVLPALRQHGGYMMSASPTESEQDILARAFVIAQQTIARQQESLKTAQTQLVEATPKIEAYTVLLDAEGTYNLTETAKHFDMSCPKLTAFLREQKWLFRKCYNMNSRVNIPFQPIIDKGYSIVKTRRMPSGKIYPQTFITPRGLVAIERLLRKHDMI